MFFHATDAAALVLAMSLIGRVGTQPGCSEDNIRMAMREGRIHIEVIVEWLQGSYAVLGMKPDKCMFIWLDGYVLCVWRWRDVSDNKCFDLLQTHGTYF